MRSATGQVQGSMKYFDHDLTEALAEDLIQGMDDIRMEFRFGFRVQARNPDVVENNHLILTHSEVSCLKIHVQ